MNWEQIFQVVVPSFLSGSVVGGLIGWQVEKRRKRLEYRMALVKAWREALLPAVSYHRDPDGVVSFTKIPAYASLRPHLSAETIRAIEGRTVIAGSDGLRQRLMTEVADIERRWGLV